MEKHGISARDNRAAQLAHTAGKLYRDKEWLEQRYVKEGLNLAQIAGVADCSVETIRTWLKRHGIPVRGYAEVTKIRWDRGEFDSEEVRRKHSTALKRVWESEKRRRKTSGKNNYNWRGGPVKCACRACGGEFEVAQWDLEHREGRGSFCSLGCKYRWYTGERNWAWKDGISFEPYGLEWTKKLRQSIRKRDNHQCAICSKPARCVHHIDENKQNNNPANLITLDKHCHAKVHHNMEWWGAILSPIALARTNQNERG